LKLIIVAVVVLKVMQEGIGMRTHIDKSTVCCNDALAYKFTLYT
jgi:hypothetical protein